MRKAWTLFVLSVMIAGLGILVGARDAAASFHIMRVYGVMGGAGGNADIQFVELRMPDSGQNLLVTGSGGTAVLCFFDAGGAPYARFKFPSNVANGADEASILIGTPEFDANWAAGIPDFVFDDDNVGNDNTEPIPPATSAGHPVRVPAGKVSFGTDTATVPSAMCGASFSVIDSVAYGTAYTDTVNFGTKLNTDLPSAGFQNAKVQGPTPAMPANGSLCFPGSFFSNCSVARNNSVDYSIVGTNDAGNQPRNNSNQTGPVACVDADGDCVGDGSDLCPATAPSAPVDASGCSQAQVDSDGDGVCDPGAPSGGPGPCTGTDNCPATPNTGQTNTDASLNAAGAMLFGAPLPGDANGDACDPDDDNDQFADDIEGAISTSPLDNCPAPAGPGPGGDSWPLDINASSSANVSDILFYKGKTPHAVQEPTWPKRMDLDNNNSLNVSDILKFKGKTPSSCT